MNATEQLEAETAIEAILAAELALGHRGHGSELTIGVSTHAVLLAVANGFGMAMGSFTRLDTRTTTEHAGRSFGWLYVSVKAGPRRATDQEVFEETARRVRQAESDARASAEQVQVPS